MGTAVTIGKFDGFHLGHKLLLDKIRTYAEERNVKSICYKLDFGGAAILSPEEQEKLAAEAGIDEFIRVPFTPEFASSSPEDFVKNILIGELGAEHIVVGTDFCFGKNREGNVELLKSLSDKYGFTVDAVEKLKLDGEVVSSTGIRALLEEGDAAGAEKRLGRSYGFSGKVGSGKHLGRSLGFPTVNIVPGESKLLPKFGVYASRTIVEGKIYGSITNVGIRPSVDDGDTANVETFIYDFSDDIYGEDIRVELLKFIRAERKFESLDALKEQISLDIETAKL